MTVTARNTNTGFIQSAVTEADGKYRFGALPLGTYEIKAELTGFTTATVTNLTLTDQPRAAAEHHDGARARCRNR